MRTGMVLGGNEWLIVGILRILNFFTVRSMSKSCIYKSEERLYQENVLGLKYPDDIPDSTTLYPNDPQLIKLSTPNKRLDDY
jgi:hypothetical protein